MSVAEVLDHIVLKANLDINQRWALFEVICNQELGKALGIMGKCKM